MIKWAGIPVAIGVILIAWQLYRGVIKQDEIVLRKQNGFHAKSYKPLILKGKSLRIFARAILLYGLFISAGAFFATVFQDEDFFWSGIAWGFICIVLPLTVVAMLLAEDEIIR